MSAMSLIDAHLEQIAACSQTISELNFPQSKIFTNALLQSHDITTLIRDTEAHERALFTVPPAPKSHEQNRRSTVFPTNGQNPLIAGGGPNAVRAPRRNTAVAAVLGGDLVERIKRGGGGGAGSGLGYREGGGRDKGEVDVDVLLEGAEKLCSVYPIPGAADRIAHLRQRHARLASSIAYYEERAAQQAEQLSLLNKPRNYDDDEDFHTKEEENATEELQFTKEDMEQEEVEIKELEKKKRGLEDRVTAMEKDIDGLK